MVKARRRILKDVSVISVHCNMISFQLFYIDKGASLLGWLNFKRLDFNVTRLEKRPVIKILMTSTLKSSP